MKKSKLVSNILMIAGVSLFIFHRYVNHFLEENNIYIAVPLFYFIVGLWFFIFFVQKFNLMVRESELFKPYFTSRYNPLTSKIRRVHEIDLPKELLFKKLIEIMPRIGFIIKHSDEKKGTIHAITPITEIVMGEIIYISLTDVNDKSMLEFYSSSISPPGLNHRYILRERNERNYKKLLQEYEESLII
jgi:hypothetical protein